MDLVFQALREIREFQISLSAQVPHPFLELQADQECPSGQAGRENHEDPYAHRRHLCQEGRDGLDSP